MSSGLERLSATDAGFLANERGNAHMHVGAIMVCDGPAPTHAGFLAHIAGRLDRVPRYRQRLVHPPLELGLPVWADDPDFDLDYHVRRTALAAPGGQAELERFTERLMSQRLDRLKPLWELWLVEGLDEGRFALVYKIHHAVVDGASGMDIITALVDLEQEPAAADPVVAAWRPRPTPTARVLATRAIEDVVRRPLRVARQALGGASDPRNAASSARRILAGLGQVGGILGSGEPRSPINGPVSPHRSYTWTTIELSALREIRKALGGTVNDVYLAVIAGGLRTWLLDRGEDPGSVRLRAVVPVSVRSDADAGVLGNRLAGFFTVLPIASPTAEARLSSVIGDMEHLKAGSTAVAMEVLTGLQEFAPPTILAQASRLSFSTRLYNLMVSNVPGPQRPVYVMGARMRAFAPVAFLAEDKRLAIACVSYDGTLCVGLLGDRAALGDLSGLAAAISAATHELVAAATGRPAPARVPPARESQRA